VLAVDGDRSVSSPVVYSLISGPKHLFKINEENGVIFSTAELDRENANGLAGEGAYVLAVRASEAGAGGQQPYADVELTIILEASEK